MKFRVKAGSAQVEGRHYKRGQTVESDTNLVKSYPEKFELVATDEPQVQPEPAETGDDDEYQP